MTIEAAWYASYDAAGNPPKSNRLIRLPSRDQLGMAFDLALDFRAGNAGYRATGRNSITGETHWWWPRPGAKNGGWWMLPPRTLKIMDRAIDYARARAREPHAPSPRNLTRDQRVTVELLRLQRAAHRPKRSVPADYEAPEWTAPAVRKKWIERVHSVPFDDPWRRYDRRGPQPSYTAVAL